MKILKRYAPLLFVAALFLGDKLFLLPVLRDPFIKWEGREMFIYESKGALRERLARYCEKRNPCRYDLLLGTSRSMAIFRTSPSPSAPPLFNFSAPGASPSWYHYALSDILKGVSAPPRRIFVEIDSPLFGRRSNLLPLKYSYDTPYIFRNSNFYPGRKGPGFQRWELELFLLNRWMATVRIPPDPRTFLANREKILYRDPAGGALHSGPKGEVFKRINARMIRDSLKNRGAFRRLYLIPASEEAIRKRYLSTYSKYIATFQESEVQREFFLSLLNLATYRGSEVVLFWPLAHPLLERAVEERGLGRHARKFLRDGIERVRHTRTGAVVRFFGPGSFEDFGCRRFADSHHITAFCADRFMIRLAEMADRADAEGDGSASIPDGADSFRDGNKK